MTDLRTAAQQALEALKYMHEEKCDYVRRNNLGDPLREDAARLALPAIEALETALAQAKPVQDQDVEDAIEDAYWQFDCRKKGLNEWASAPQSERDAFKAEARKLVRGYFPTRKAQDTKREMLAVADAFIRGKRSALAQAEQDVGLPSLCSAIAKHLGESWLVVGPDGSRFVAPTPFRAASAANKHFGRLHHDPEKAAEFAAMIDKVRRDSERENDRLMAMYGSLNCPTCGGSGHIGDAASPAVQEQAEPVHPSGFAYRYPDGVRFNDGCEVNGCLPSEVIPYYLGKAPPKAEPGPCDHCSSPLFAGVRCRVCGRKAEQIDEAPDGP